MERKKKSTLEDGISDLKRNNISQKKKKKVRYICLFRVIPFSTVLPRMPNGLSMSKNP